MAAQVKREVCLVVIDGWGLAPPSPGNAITNAVTPVMDGFTEGARDKKYAYGKLYASEVAVGLPEGQMGNSEVGHQNIGGGQIPYQDIVRIDLSINDGSMAHNPALVDAFKHAKAHKGKVHFAGLVSDGGVHSHIRHLFGLLRIAKDAGVESVVHAFTDGRDTPPTSAVKYLADLQNFMAKDLQGYGQIGVIVGRYWAMDRDKKWDRVEAAYRAMVLGEGEQITSAGIIEAVERRYKQNETDEFLKPIVVDGKAGLIKEGDAIVMFDFRADRMRAITHVIGGVQPHRVDVSSMPKNTHLACMTQYNEEFTFPLIIPVQVVKNVLAEWLSSKNIRQCHIGETEKFAHVTFFFNGRREEPFPLEDRVLVPSPAVATYDLKPNMSQFEVGEKVMDSMRSGNYPFVICNLAPPDMVGHTGVYDATVIACAGTDKVIGQIWEVCKETGHVLMITSDHGNAEQMFDEKGGPFTAHTMNYVPFILADPKGEITAFNHEEGILADVAPTILKVMGLDVPAEMTGKSFL